MKKYHSVILGVLFSLALLAGGMTVLLLPKEDFSEAERRPLALLPEWNAETVLDGSCFEDTDLYVVDHFAGREEFRHIKACWEFFVLRSNENNGLVRSGKSIMKLEKHTNAASLAYAANRLGAVYDAYLKNTDCGVFFAVVPDKSAFLKDKGYPTMDLSEMETALSACLPGAKQLSLSCVLSLNDYYLTDTHWRQERLLPVAGTLLSGMGRPCSKLQEGNFSVRSYEPFYGVYAGQSALRPAPETIFYLEDGPLANCTVTDLLTVQKLPLYDPDGCDERDPYTLFLGGSKGLLRIENPDVSDGKELVVFRDSFGSSIAPLLAAEYSTVTLVDIRYVNPQFLRRYLRFDNRDVLFLYSATLLNNSQALQ